MKAIFENHTAASLTKSYEPEQFEKELYAFWELNGCFDANDENELGQESFCIVIPPPNVTGVLHMGHALTNTIQDILVRWKRMHGYNTLWLPGTDHAGIATQTQVEKAIAKEGKGPTGKPLTRHDLGREKFLERTWKWKDDHAHIITSQLKRLGSSLDWKRERFTMDEGLSQAVREVFVRLYNDGLIYRGERIINWCVRCQTALSDLEVIPTDRKGSIWQIIYPVVEADGTPVKDVQGNPLQLTIATTRPETLLGDTAVAIHPEDERYILAQGKFAVLPLLGRKIPIICDAYVDREFGTGALKVTPAHDFNDYEIAKRHDLPFVSVVGKDGVLTAAGGPYAGLKMGEARERVLQDLKEKGLLVKSEEHANKVGLCQRCETIAEPIVSKQWFVKIEPLAKPAIEAIQTGKTVFAPKSWEKTYFEWMNNIRDWCISRQLWWGHQIPAWYCGECNEITVEKSNPSACKHCGAKAEALKQDEDVLDTWFSSALWPFSTLGWPQNTAALNTFYPTSILETGFDIIFFWVARMMMMGIHFMGKIPFERIYMHAMVRDEKGEKMSKSKGNVIDPLTVIEKHGADPLRFTLAAMAGQGRDIKLSVDRVEGYRAFANKLWNAVKFLHLQYEEANGGALVEPSEGAEAWIKANWNHLESKNKWILSRLEKTVEVVNLKLESFELNEAAQALYEYTWHELCDWYIEFSKISLRAQGSARKETLIVLHFALERLLKVMHPFMPFVSEQLWQTLPWKKESQSINNQKARQKRGLKPLLTLMLQEFPVKTHDRIDEEAEKNIESLKNIILAIRNFRGENNLSPKVKFSIFYTPQTADAKRLMEKLTAEVCTLGGVDHLSELSKNDLQGRGELIETLIPLQQPMVEIRIPLKGLVNVDEETKRIQKEIEKAKADLAHVAKKLTNEAFVAKAPAALLEKEKENEKNYQSKLIELDKALERIKKLQS